jgi:hypothetical protein
MSIRVRGISAEVSLAVSESLLTLCLRCGDHEGPTCYVQSDSAATAQEVAAKIQNLAKMVVKVAPSWMRESD